MNNIEFHSEKSGENIVVRESQGNGEKVLKSGKFFPMLNLRGFFIALFRRNPDYCNIFQVLTQEMLKFIEYCLFVVPLCTKFT